LAPAGTLFARLRAMADLPRTRHRTKRAAGWGLPVMALDDPPRSYDRRYQQADLTYERARSEALLAAALASEYAPPSALGAASVAALTDPLATPLE
jgi:hypothetical protein